MKINKNTACGFGSVRRKSGRGSVVKSRDRRCSEAADQPEGLLCAARHGSEPKNHGDVAALGIANWIETGNRAIASVLDGEAVVGTYGYDALDQERRLHVPHYLAADAAEALVLCQQQGVILSKLANMTPEAAFYALATTLARPITPS